MNYDEDKIATPPTVIGQHGRAWRLDLAALRRKRNITREQDATLDMWLIEAAWAHPAWHSYLMILIHLRPMSDRRETIFYLDSATREMWLYALDPHHPREPALSGDTEFMPLVPCNFAAQFIEVEDHLAQDRIMSAAVAVTHGHLSPDTDFLSRWIALFGDNMVKPKCRERTPA